MARRRLTIKRVDPWSVLKFGAVVSVAFLAIGLVIVGVVLFFVDRLGLIDQACGIARDVGFTACGLNLGNLFRAVALLGLLLAIINTAVLVFASFLHNLIADLTGGITLSVVDDGATIVRGTAAAATTTGGTPASTTGGSSAAMSTGSGRPPVPPLGSDQERDRGGSGRGNDAADRTEAFDREGDDLFRGR